MKFALIPTIFATLNSAVVAQAAPDLDALSSQLNNLSQDQLSAVLGKLDFASLADKVSYDMTEKIKTQEF